jgi:tetratricopeptide (TPR) repeat protein
MRAAAVSPSEHRARVFTGKLLEGRARTAGMRSADLRIVFVHGVLMKSLSHRLFAVAIAALPLADVASGAELHPQVPTSHRSPIPAESFDDLLKEAKAFEKEFQAEDALPLYLAAEKLAPKNPELLVRIARQYRYLMTDASDTPEKLRLGRMALEYSTRAAACGPKNCDAQLAPAITLGKMLPYLPTKQQVAASPQIKESVDKALALDSHNDTAWHVLGRWNRVLAEVSSAKRFVAGLVYGQLPKGSIEEAEQDMKRAIAINPHRLMHYIELGRIYAEMGRKQEAREFINKGLAMPDTEKDDPETKQRGRETLAKL